MADILLKEVVDKYDLQPFGRPSGGEQGYLCPVGGKHFDVNFGKDRWHCFHQCTGCTKNGGGAYAMWCMLNGVDPDADIKKSFRAFCLEFEGNSELHKKAVEITAKAQVEAPVESPKAPDEDCDRAYRALLSRCKLTKAHMENLLQRGFSPKDISHYGFKSLPQIGVQKMCQEIIAEGINLSGVPGFYKKANGKWTLLLSGSGYFIPYKNKDGQIIGLQVRYDIDITGLKGKDLKEAKRRRYRWVSSSGVSDGTAMTLVPYLGEPRGNDRAVYVTEGGLKAMAASALANRWFAAIPGINCYSVYRDLLTYLKSCGITTIVDAWDTDRYENESVQNSINMLYQIAQDEFGFVVKQWDSFMHGKEKGVDDYLVMLKAEKEAAKKRK